MSELNYEEDLLIDPDQLDVEWLNQPNLFMRYAEASARANRRAKKFVEDVKTVRSELVLQCMKNPDECLGEGVKPSDAKAEAYYRQHKSYQEAKLTAIEAEHKAEILNNVIYAFHQRKAALESLVALLHAKYFAGPRDVRNLGSEFGKNVVHQKAAEAVKNNTKRRRTK